jgi:branched-chain amino acid transport system ATP-binding protein
MTDTLLKTDNLSVAYGAAPALHGVTFEAATAEIVAVLGANGAGKSTLARACSGLVPAKSGRIQFGGRDITGLRAHRVRRAGIVYLPEGRGILPGLSVADNLRMAVTLVPRSQRPAAIEHAYELFPALAGRRNLRAGSLSGGEQQMLSLARALAITPRVVIADEMSLGLAPMVVDLVFSKLQEARQAGVTVILIEQFIHRALAISDRCVILRRGEVAWAGPTSAAAEEALTRYLGEAV